MEFLFEILIWADFLVFNNFTLSITKLFYKRMSIDLLREMYELLNLNYKHFTYIESQKGKQTSFLAATQIEQYKKNNTQLKMKLFFKLILKPAM